MHWIKAEIHEYILKNWRMVKVATTKAQRKLFFNLRSMKQGLKEDALDADTHRNTLTPAEVGHGGARAERQAGRSGRDGNAADRRRRRAGAADPTTARRATPPSPTWPTTAASRRGAWKRMHRDWLAGDGIAQALHTLDARSRRIVEERWLKVNDDASGGMTLHELAAEYGVSAERIRQIEVAALKKMRKVLA